MAPSSRDHPGTLIHAPSLGRAWLEATRAIVAEGQAATYSGLPTVEVMLLDIVIDDPSLDDGLIESFGDPERLSWMRTNFTDYRGVEELGMAASYATRLYDYEASGLDQVAWVTERLRDDPSSRSALITTLQPLSDTSYVPCVSLLHFWLLGTSLELVVTAHSIDLATKGYANLVELAAIQRRVAESLSVQVGRLILRISSAHLYERDLGFVRSVLAKSEGC
jgi:thymidylate synthase